MEKQAPLQTPNNQNATTPRRDMLSNGSSQAVTPKSIASIKSGKLRQDLGARAHEAILQEQELVLKQEAERYKQGLD